MTGQAEKARGFLELHRSEHPLLMPNAWDAGSAKLLVAHGFDALATTSSGHAATLGRLDGSVTREEAVAHAAALVAAAGTRPVSADFESGFGDDPGEVAWTVELGLGAGLAGCSVEDWSGGGDGRIYELELAAERIRAAATAAHAGPVRLVLTARAENLIHGRPDLTDTIARLQAYEAAGADVLFAPGLSTSDEIRAVVDAVDAPVNVLARPGLPSTSELAALGVARISVGGAFAFAALAALVDAANELRERGTYGYLERTSRGHSAIRSAFADR